MVDIYPENYGQFFAKRKTLLLNPYPENLVFNVRGFLSILTVPDRV